MLLKDNIIHINIRPGLLLGLFYVYITTIFAKDTILFQAKIDEEKWKTSARTSIFITLNRHLPSLRLPFVAFDLVICGFWAPHLPQVRGSKHSFCKWWKCKENGRPWIPTTYKTVIFSRFSHQSLIRFKKQAFLSAIIRNLFYKTRKPHTPSGHAAFKEYE